MPNIFSMDYLTKLLCLKYSVYVKPACVFMILFFIIAMTVLQSSFLHDTHLYVFFSVLESLQYDCNYLIICILPASCQPMYVNVYKNPVLLSMSVEHLKHSIKTAGMLIIASEVNYDL